MVELAYHIFLDGLHENLNRVKCQPHKKLREVNGRSDEDIADEHKARNDSLIVDIFQGQYKSTLVCPICNKGSSTFDPFMYVSLPIVPTNTRSMTINVFTSDGSAPPSVYRVSNPKRGRCKDLIQAIVNVCSLKRDEKLLLAQIRTHLIDRFLEDPLMTLSSIKDDDVIVAYKIPNNTTNQKFLQLIHRVEDMQNGNTTRWKPFGIPLISPISCNEVVIARSEVQLTVHAVLSPMSRTINGEKHNNGVVTANQPNLPLQLVDENNSCIDLSALQTEFIKFSSSSKVMIVFVDWSKKLLEEYDTSCLENLPQVGKYGLVTKKDRVEHHLSLYTCLEGYLCEEPLTPNEHMWYCPRCEAQRQASKKLDLWRLPEVIIFHLKRFSSPTKNLETFVDFPLNDLDLTNYVPNKTNSLPQRYELYALVNHCGNMASGHYNAHIKMQDENRWYNFDDKHVTPISEDEVKAAGAYVLFYKRIKDDDSMREQCSTFLCRS